MRETDADRHVVVAIERARPSGFAESAWLRQEAIALRARGAAARSWAATLRAESERTMTPLMANPQRRETGAGSARESVADLVKEVADLRRALATRDLIWTAKTLVAGMTHCTPEEAHAILVQQSQFENRKVRDIALELVQRHG